MTKPAPKHHHRATATTTPRPPQEQKNNNQSQIHGNRMGKNIPQEAATAQATRTIAATATPPRRPPEMKLEQENATTTQPKHNNQPT
eukprot:15341514-Ditylum_brightwellii.AAC.1